MIINGNIVGGFNFSQFMSKIVSVTLLASNWIDGADDNDDLIPDSWSQVVLQGNDLITPYSKVDLQPSVEQMSIFHEKDLAFITENDDGVVTVFCVGQKPTNDYTVQATISEVSENG